MAAAAAPTSVRIPHLGGSMIGCRLARALDHRRPTLILVNSFLTSVELYRPQFADAALSGAVNLLALELYGHGATRTACPQFTYWDSAIANLQVMEALDLDTAWVLGTSQGGWVATRMAMLAPERILGIIPLGTSMDFESAESQALGCWNAREFLSASIAALAGPVDNAWHLPVDMIDAVLAAGFGENVPASERAFWHRTMQQNYAGDDGRQRVRLSAINLRDRDGLLARLDGVQCPVLWMHGTEDTVYSIDNAEDNVARFSASADARLEIVPGGQHFLSASDPAAVNRAVLRFMGC